MEKANPNAELIARLRELADFLEAHPELPECYSTPIFDLSVYGEDAKEQLAHFAKVAGRVEKSATYRTFYLRKSFGPIRLDMNAMREQVCERVLVGTKVEPEHFIPAQPETFVPAQEVPIYEWRCGSILAVAEAELERTA